MKVNYFGCTDTGKMRENNEDAFLAHALSTHDWILGCVIDGVGGYSGGEVAADLAKRSIEEIFSKDAVDISASMKSAFNKANAAILAEKQKSPELEQMACVLTLVIADLSNNQFHYAHVGDTRLYLFRDHSLVKVSKDHSFVGFLEDTGRLSEAAAMQHPKRNEINKALGFSAALEAEDYIEMGTSPFLPGDLLLLCSDGVTDMLSKTQLTELLEAKSSLEAKAKSIIHAANEKGGKDNSTVVLICNDKQRLQQEATKPIIKKKEEGSGTLIVKSEPAAISGAVKKNNGTLLFLTLICLGLLVALSWALWKLYKPAMVIPTVTVDSVYQKHPLARQLQQSIDASPTDTLVLSDSAFPGPVILSDTIIIRRAGLYLKANGAIKLVADSGYKGPAFYAAVENENFAVDSVLFQDFRIAIQPANGNVQLKNVRFENCQTAVSQNYFFPGNYYINGSTKSQDFYMDSLPVTKN